VSALCADSFEPQARRYNPRLAGTLAPPKMAAVLVLVN
jgi:hypothetical protein